MIEIVVVGIPETQAKLGKITAALRAGLKSAAEREAVGLADYVKRMKLSGQVLKVQTGTLRRSISWAVSATDTGVVGAVGTSVRYGRAHEYGWAGVQNVRSRRGKTFARRMRFPERSFLRSSLAERKEHIVQALSQAVKAAAKDAGFES